MRSRAIPFVIFSGAPKLQSLIVLALFQGLTPLPSQAREVLKQELKLISLIFRANRDKGKPRGFAPPAPLGIRITYLGGSVDLVFIWFSHRDSAVPIPLLP
jgi:hypothetical protein